MILWNTLPPRDTRHHLYLTRVSKYTTQRSREPVVRISLYYQFQTPAESERIYRSSLNIQGIFPTSQSLISVKSKLIPNGATLIIV